MTSACISDFNAFLITTGTLGLGVSLYYLRRAIDAKVLIFPRTLSVLPFLFLICSLAAMLGGVLGGLKEAHLVKELRKACSD